jgi:hypothetical protein
MKKTDCDFMLSFSHISIVDSQPGIFTGFENYYYFREKNHIFQPAIWKKSCLEEFCETFDTNFHGNEYEECLNFSRKKILYSVQNKNTVEKFRTTNSLLFPHMHAISTLGTGVQEWTFKKYPSLKSIIESYGVRTDDKGINQIWEIDTQ